MATFAVTAQAAPLPAGEALIRLSWERLALLVARDATFEATSVDPPLLWAAPRLPQLRRQRRPPVALRHAAHVRWAT